MTSILVSCVAILAGAGLMLTGIVKSRLLLEAMPFVQEPSRQHVANLIRFHRGFMCLFFVGYIVVFLGFAFQWRLLSEMIVSGILLFGALFVLMGITIQARLLSEIEGTLSGLLPICAKCKRIRQPDSDSENPTSWQQIESYIKAHTHAEFTHGYCPHCCREIMKQLDSGEEKST